MLQTLITTTSRKHVTKWRLTWRMVFQSRQVKSSLRIVT